MMKNSVIKIGLLQSQALAEQEQNLKKTFGMIRQAAKQGANIVCTQELFLSKYFCQTQDINSFDLAHSIPGTITKQLGQLAQELSIVIIASLFEKSMSGVYHNAAVVFDLDGKLVGKYRKTHIPDDAQYLEKYYFTPGQDLNCVFDTALGRIGVLVCWDQWFPEAARSVALQGADILFYPTAIGWHDSEQAEFGDIQKDAWQTVQRGHAIANGLPVCAVNRVGCEENLTFWGGSFICDAFGQLLAVAGETETILMAELDLRKNETQRREWPFFRDRRIELYGHVTEPYA